MTAVAASIARIWLATAAMARRFGRGGGQFSTSVTAMAATPRGRETRGARDFWAKKTPAGRPGFEQLKKEELLFSSVQKVSY